MTVKSKVFLRADGGSRTGMGHIFRLLALAEMLAGFFECHFIIREPTETVQKNILETCNAISKIPADIPFSEEAKWCSELVQSDSDIFVLDGYKFDSEYQHTLKATNAALVCIDDIYAYHFHADAVINHAPGISATKYSLDEQTKFCGGLNYVVVRSKFLQQAKKERKISKIKKLFICFGGADFNNLSFQVLSILAKRMPKQISEISVVLGEANIYKEEVQKASTALTNVKVNLLYNLSADEMIAEMEGSQVAILPSSTILYEAIAIKMPIISGYYVDNQVSVYHGFNELGLIYGVGDINEFDNYHSLLEKIISDDIQDVLERQARHLDGSSKRRFRSLFLNLSGKFRLKAANATDVNMYFEWANDAAVRKNAISTDPINIENHISWFTKKLEHKNCFMYILFWNDIAVGQIRFDIENEEATIDYSIDRDHRGNGLGKILLELGISQLSMDLKKAIHFKAIVKNHNVASNKVFENIGFERVDTYASGNEFYNVFQLKNSY